MSEVLEVASEREIKTPLGRTITADIVLYGPQLIGNELPLAVIELEYTHRFEALKCLLCRAMGIILISVDMSGMTEKDVTRDWCRQVLQKLKHLATEKEEGIHIYLPYSLYPVYLDIGRQLRGQKHAYTVLPRDRDYTACLKTGIDVLKKSLHLSDEKALAKPFNPYGNDDQIARAKLEKLGPLAGRNWRDYSMTRYITIISEVPVKKKGQSISIPHWPVTPHERRLRYVGSLSCK